MGKLRREIETYTSASRRFQRKKRTFCTEALKGQVSISFTLLVPELHVNFWSHDLHKQSKQTYLRPHLRWRYLSWPPTHKAKKKKTCIVRWHWTRMIIYTFVLLNWTAEETNATKTIFFFLLFIFIWNPYRDSNVVVNSAKQRWHSFGQ